MLAVKFDFHQKKATGSGRPELLLLLGVVFVCTGLWSELIWGGGDGFLAGTFP
jgi:hypothetical protein